jgi:hypothetical protein
MNICIYMSITFIYIIINIYFNIARNKTNPLNHKMILNFKLNSKESQPISHYLFTMFFTSSILFFTTVIFLELSSN